MEIGEFGSTPAINALATGKRFKIVGGGCRQWAHLYFCAAKEINSYDSLKGKRVGALGVGSCSDWIARQIVVQNGLAPDRDIEFVPLLKYYPRVVELVAAGALDACMIAEPNVSIGEERGMLDFWAAGYEAPYLPNYQWIVRVARDALIDRELPHFNLDCEIDMEGLQISADLQQSLDGIAKPMQAEELVDLRFLPNGKMAA